MKLINQVFFKEMNRKKIPVFILAACTFLLAIIDTVLITEIARRITETLILTDWANLIRIIYFSILICFIGIILTLCRAAIRYYLIKDLYISLENEAIYNYHKLDSWRQGTDPGILIPIIKYDLPDISEKGVDLYVSLFYTIITVIMGCIYAAGLNGFILVVCILGLLFTFVLTRKHFLNLPAMEQELGKLYNINYNNVWEVAQCSEVIPFLNTSNILDKYKQIAYSNTQFVTSKSKSLAMVSLGRNLYTIGIIILIAICVPVINVFFDVIIPLASVFALFLIIPKVAASLFSTFDWYAKYKQFCGQMKRANILYECNSCINEVKKDIDEISSLKVTNLSFSFKENREIIHNLSFSIHKGQSLCITGLTGEGKSTLLRLCANLLVGYTGSIEWNNIDLQEINRASLWKNISYMDQTPRCIPGSILENIVVGNELENHEERLRKAILDSSLKEIIIKLPAGIHTPTENLSSGELQKVCIARSLYRQSSVLIMDEATSAIDPVSEKEIFVAIKRRIEDENIMVLVISHNPNVINQLDYTINIKRF